VTIDRPGIGPQLGDRNWALLYVPEQRYQRHLVDPEGDDCTFLELSAALHDDLLDSADEAPRTFERGRVLVDNRTWLAYQDCIARADRAGPEPADPLSLESRLFSILTELLNEPPDAPGAPTDVLPRDPRSRSRAYRRVHDACVVMSTNLDERMTISAVAESVGLSAFHFCRQFRAVTGLTVHAYRERLRLRHAFSTCASVPSQKLSDVALEAGYASHSHMTTSFRNLLRMSPSGVRDRYALEAAKTGIGEQPFSFR
jgi:AraC-like DNA-binding protein